MKLYRYLLRLQNTIYSRREIEVERLVIHPTTALSGQIWGRLHFYDGSLLEFEEKLTLRDDDIEKIDYRYHYQRADGTLIVRYDNAPHYPELPGFPNHKHTLDFGKFGKGGEENPRNQVFKPSAQLLWCVGSDKVR